MFELQLPVQEVGALLTHQKILLLSSCTRWTRNYRVQESDSILRSSHVALGVLENIVLAVDRSALNDKDPEEVIWMFNQNFAGKYIICCFSSVYSV